MYKPWNGHLEGEQPYLGGSLKNSLTCHSIEFPGFPGTPPCMRTNSKPGLQVPDDAGLVGRFNLQTFAMDPATAMDLTTINTVRLGGMWPK